MIIPIPGGWICINVSMQVAPSGGHDCNQLKWWHNGPRKLMQIQFDIKDDSSKRLVLSIESIPWVRCASGNVSSWDSTREFISFYILQPRNMSSFSSRKSRKEATQRAYNSKILSRPVGTCHSSFQALCIWRCRNTNAPTQDCQRLQVPFLWNYTSQCR